MASFYNFDCYELTSPVRKMTKDRLKTFFCNDFFSYSLTNQHFHSDRTNTNSYNKHIYIIAALYLSGNLKTGLTINFICSYYILTFLTFCWNSFCNNCLHNDKSLEGLLSQFSCIFLDALLNI